MSVAGYLTILVLMIMSVIMGALGWELGRRSRSVGLDGEWLLAQLRYLLLEQKRSKEETREYLRQLDRPVADLCAQLIAMEAPSIERGDYLLSALLEQKRLDLEQGLAHLGTIAVIAPFVGLFGTVVGITKTFADVAKIGKAGIEVVSAGVSEALIATAIGLLVAIVSVVLFNQFKSRFDRTVVEWDVTAKSLLSLLVGTPRDHVSLLTPRVPPSTASAEKFLQSLGQE